VAELARSGITEYFPLARRMVGESPVHRLPAKSLPIYSWSTGAVTFRYPARTSYNGGVYRNRTPNQKPTESQPLRLSGPGPGRP